MKQNYLGITALATVAILSSCQQKETAMTLTYPETKKEGVIDAAIWMGYPWADEPRNHGVVVVYGDNKDEVAKSSEYLAKSFWDVKDEFVFVAPVGTLKESINLDAFGLPTNFSLIFASNLSFCSSPQLIASGTLII